MVCIWGSRERTELLCTGKREKPRVKEPGKTRERKIWKETAAESHIGEEVKQPGGRNTFLLPGLVD